MTGVQTCALPICSVEHLVQKLHFKKNPERIIDNTPLTPVTRENVDAFAKNWEKWLPK